MRRGPIAFVVTAVLLLFAPVLPAQHEAPEPPDSVMQGAQADRQAEAAPDQPETEPAPGWWNVDAVVERLQLSPIQRSRMDALNREHRQARARHDEQVQALTRQLREAFAAAELESARRINAKLASQTAGTDGATLKLEILSLLSEEQLARLQSDYPDVLAKPWRRNTRRLVQSDAGIQADRSERHKRARRRAADAADDPAGNDEDD